MKKIVMLMLVAVILTGCMPKRNVTREDWLAMSSHTFPNTTVDKVLIAGDKVAKSIDPKFTNVMHAENKMEARRIADIFSNITMDYNLTASKINNDVDAKLELVTHMGPSLKINEQWHEAYNLFFNRMESVLYGKEWIVCEEAENNVENSNTLQSLCFKAQDEVPRGVKLSPASQKITNERIEAKALQGH